MLLVLLNMFSTQYNEFDFSPIYRADSAGPRILSFDITLRKLAHAIYRDFSSYKKRKFSVAFLAHLSRQAHKVSL